MLLQSKEVSLGFVGTAMLDGIPSFIERDEQT